MRGVNVSASVNRVVIVGAGQAGAQTSISLRLMGYEGQIVVIGDEPAPPYQRPPLSKGYLKGELSEDRLYLKPESYYSESNVDLRLSTRATRLDSQAKTLELEDGQKLDWDALVLATGARPRRLAVSGAKLEGVLELRTLGDVDQLKPYAREGVRAVVIGAGYIGLEAAAVLSYMGGNVTVLEAAPQVLGRVTGPEVAQFIVSRHQKSGVEIRVDAKLEGFVGSDKLEGVQLAGGEVLPCDVALVGVGVLPNIELAEEAGIACGNGIIVDEWMKTRAPDVYAIGDVALRPLQHYKREGRLESVHNAIEGGKIAAAAILGKDMPTIDVPWFWSDQYEIKLQTAGLWTGADTRVLRGDPETGKFAVYYLKDGVIIAVDAVSSPPDFIVGKKLVAAHATVAPDVLRDTSRSIKEISAAALGG